MGSDDGRWRISGAVFWIFLSVAIIVLACGWGAAYAPLDEAWRRYLGDLHRSLGLVGALLIGAQFLISLASLFFGGGSEPFGWRRILMFLLRQSAYLSFLASAITGAAAAVFNSEQIFFFGFPLPYADGVNQAVADGLRGFHPAAAYVLAGAITVNLIAAALGFFFSEREPAVPAPAPVVDSVQSMIVDGLVHSFQFFGRIAFWVQSITALLSAPLLLFSFVGHTVSPSQTIFGDTIYWASGGLALLVVSVLFQALLKRIATAIRLTPERYLGLGRQRPFWFLGPSGFVSIIGVVVSFIGVGSSVALLIGKTVSQPPGIAITDPNKIIRALDVFVLLVNFNLLFAHFVGFAVTAWLSVSALKAHHQYGISVQSKTRSEPLEEPRAPEA